MSDYSGLRHRINNGEVIILDGAVGTQLQGLGSPIGATAWAAVALHTHPETVRFMHETYIKDGVDIITTNTFSSGRQCLEPLGIGDLTRELNLRAVVLAQEARDRTAKERPVYIGGAVSHYGVLVGGEPLPEIFYRDWSNYTEEQCKANIREQAEILVDSGVDFLITEATGGTLQRKWIVEACLATGVPTWIGFKCRTDKSDGLLKTGYSSEDPFTDDLDEIIPLGGDLATVFHTSVDDTTRSIPILQENWSGPIGVYPDADRHDYVKKRQDDATHNHTSPDDFLKLAQGWVAQGAQVIGGCCGFGFDYIKPLREGLPSHIPTPGSRRETDE